MTSVDRRFFVFGFVYNGLTVMMCWRICSVNYNLALIMSCRGVVSCTCGNGAYVTVVVKNFASLVHITVFIF